MSRSIKLIVQGGGVFHVTSTGIFQADQVEVTSSWKGDTLTLTGQGGNTVSISSNGISLNLGSGGFFSGNSSYNNCVISNGRIITSTSGSSGSNKVMYKGKMIDLDQAAAAQSGSSTPVEDYVPFYWKSDTVFEVAQVAVSGTGTVHLERSARVISAATSGSGDIYFHVPNVSIANLVVSGSGDIHGNTTVSVLNATVSGSGDISGFTATDSASLMSSGSGDIKLCCTRDCQVSKLSSGSSDIKIRRV